MSKQQKKIVIIDNHDSFTYNLYQIFDEHPHCVVEVVANDMADLNELKKYDGIVLSPGPDVPEKYPVLSEIISRYKHTIPILGVCLGHQAIAEFFGAELINLRRVYHGQRFEIEIDNTELLFQSLSSYIQVGLYHSWAVKRENLPKDLEVTACTKSGIIMALRHRTYNVRGIQFHPESYMTAEGKKIVANWIELQL